jgi:hypothetical protein
MMFDSVVSARERDFVVAGQVFFWRQTNTQAIASQVPLKPPSCSVPEQSMKPRPSFDCIQVAEVLCALNAQITAFSTMKVDLDWSVTEHWPLSDIELKASECLTLRINLIAPQIRRRDYSDISISPL